jgi:hypothetical protein
MLDAADTTTARDHGSLTSLPDNAPDAVTLPAAATDELLPDFDDEPLPALQVRSESGEDEAEALTKGAPSQLACDIGSLTSLPIPQRLFASPPAVPHDRVATGSHSL